MAATLAHRGPDGSGVFEDFERKFAVAHRRLSVLDLSPAGNQPMASNSGRYLVAFNGEIYNHLDLRAELEQQAGEGKLRSAWKGSSDTETLLEAFETWGIEATLERIRGMFAIALWDRELEELTLIRDRMGEKPLYFGWSGGAFLFASELTAFEAWNGFEARISRPAVTAFLRFGYVPTPHSIYVDCHKLQPGALLRIRLVATRAAPTSPVSAGLKAPGLCIQRWWSLQQVAYGALARPMTDDQEGLDQLQTCLTEACRMQLISDVPIGALLSGGIDSSLVVAILQSLSSSPVNTFTIGFGEWGYDEAAQARAVAERLGTRHAELYVSAGDALAVIPELPRIYSEPFADASQLPTCLVSRLARQSVTVALSGDGGDEMFGGYNRYRWAPQSWTWIARVPAGLRGIVASSLSALARQGSVVNFLDGAGLVSQPAEKLAKLASRMQHADSIEDFYTRLASVNPEPDKLVLQPKEAVLDLKEWVQDSCLGGIESRMMFADSMSYLPDDILCKVDRAAMAVSLETRTPYLDPRVIEMAWRLPPEMKLRGGETKWALRRLLERFLPREFFERPKRGFAVPLNQWLRGPLRDWAEDLLSIERMAQQDLLRAERVRELWRLHGAGQEQYGHALWCVLMLQAWLHQRREER